MWLRVRLDRLDVDGLRPLVAGLGVEGDLGALSQRLEAVSGNAAVADEQILPAVLRRDEAEALVVVEPLHGSSRHVLPPGHVLRTRRLLESDDLRALALLHRPHGRHLYAD